MKKYWRCHVCNDIHFGVFAPELCPTCKQQYGFVEISSSEALKIMSHSEISIDKPKFLAAIQAFAAHREFQVNPDQERVEMLTGGVFTCEQNQGLKYCPCRMIEKEFESDISLICPCNFPSA